MKIDKTKLLVPVVLDDKGKKVELPDHTDLLEKAGELLLKVKKQYKPYRDAAKKKMIELHGKDHKYEEEDLMKLQEIPYDKQLNMTYIVTEVLDSVGQMSQTRFDCRADLQERYYKMFPMAKEDVLNGLANPETNYVDVAREYYLYHTDLLHAPYDKIKNKCFDLMFKIDPQGSALLELSE